MNILELGPEFYQGRNGGSIVAETASAKSLGFVASCAAPRSEF